MLPIWAAVNEAVQSGKVPALSPKVYRLGLHLSVRLNILPRVVQRVNSGVSLLYEKIKEHGPEHVFTQAKEGYAYPLDNDLKYSLLADLDALLFELNSACELMTRLFGRLCAHAGRPIAQKHLGKAIGDVLNQNNQDAGWFISLGNHRNFFMHEGAPYIAVDLSSEPVTLDILIMKENVKTFSDPDTYVSLSEINLIVRGFLAARTQLQDYLVSLFK